MTATYTQVTTPGESVIESGKYTWSYGGGSGITITLTEATAGSPLQTLALDANNDWFIEGERATVGPAIDAYFVDNVDYIGS